MMSLKQLTEDLVRLLSKALEGECKVKSQRLEEYHGRTPYRILFLKDSDGKQAVVADIYPENYYEDYFSGQKSLDEIGESILNFYDKATGEFREEYEMLEDYSQIRNKLSFMFINRHRNRDMLKQLVYIDYGDIALILQVVFINRKQYGVVSSKINYQMLKHWGISKEQLYTDAFMSAPNITPAKIMTEDEAICECLGVPCKGDEKANMYTVINGIYQMGSGVILYKGLGEVIKKKTGKKDFYVLPSSIHELLLVPVDISVSVKELKQMVKQVNRDQVSVEDYLSDEIFTYNADTEEFKPYGKESQ